MKSVNYHGSRIMQLLASFEDPNPIMSSILHMTNKEIHMVACDKFGSWAVQKFLANPNVTQKNLNALYERFKVKLN